MPKEVILYTVRSGKNPGAFVCLKMTEDLEPKATYYVSEAGPSGLVCNCPAYKPWCRHMDILRVFQAEERVDSGYLYNLDKKTWIPPFTTD